MEYKKLTQAQRKTSHGDPNDANYRRLRYEVWQLIV
jgi:hypothetical protein